MRNACNANDVNAQIGPQSMRTGGTVVEIGLHYTHTHTHIHFTCIEHIDVDARTEEGTTKKTRYTIYVYVIARFILMIRTTVAHK